LLEGSYVNDRSRTSGLPPKHPGGKAFLAWADFSSLELIEELARDNGAKLELVKSKSTPSGLATFLVYQLDD
jgi:hypothetical protein